MPSQEIDAAWTSALSLFRHPLITKSLHADPCRHGKYNFVLTLSTTRQICLDTVNGYYISYYFCVKTQIQICCCVKFPKWCSTWLHVFSGSLALKAHQFCFCQSVVKKRNMFLTLFRKSCNLLAKYGFFSDTLISPHMLNRTGFFGVWCMKPWLSESVFLSLVNSTFKAEILSHGIGWLFCSCHVLLHHMDRHRRSKT